MKKRDAKLSLHRETLRHLDASALTKANGGIDYTGCDSACTECGGAGTIKTIQEPVLADTFVVA